MLGNTVQAGELIWTLLAVPGVVLWATNYLAAATARSGARVLNESKSVRLYTDFAAEQCAIMMAVELVFVTTGVVAMFSPANPESPHATKYVFAILFTATSIAISYVAFRWRKSNIAVRNALQTEAEPPNGDG